jgi:hypothetical protein
MAVERAIWKQLRSSGAFITRSMREDYGDVIDMIAKKFTEEFKHDAGATDQRRARRGLFAKILGR